MDLELAYEPIVSEDPAVASVLAEVDAILGE
jgi:hypothetical protein